MQLAIQQLLPVPLKEKISQQGSGVWNNEIQFEEGKFIKIKAPSGTGKTTLIHYLYNTRYDYTGKVLVNGNPWQDYNASQVAQLRQQELSIIFQDLRLFEQLTALENIQLKNCMSGKAYCTDAEIDSMANQLQVSHVLQQSAATLSYGERQRIAIIRALTQPFSWLLMDEPFSHLDENNTRKAAQLIADACKKRNAGFILTDLDDDQHFEYQLEYQL
ncbi:ABC transporter [Chitinophaga caeni]|uniref:ABC transporter n=1 Tax=Chitinophaga caeni TaxID=2029983 RepID=A0A291QRY0_9BACT|nr:ATP-binding cassette domain-containing protein [Chitinophaga caeni]ATL46675.1 ABC transporter [Chitinophaga caeni]